MPTASAAKKLEIARRRERVQELAASGLRSIYKIADALVAEGCVITYRTVARDIEAIEAAAKEKYAGDRLADKLWQVAEARQRNADLRSRIKELEAEWQRSKLDKESTRQKEVSLPVPAVEDGEAARPVAGRTETVAAVEGRLGDVSYLAEIRMVQKEIRENDEFIADLLGLRDPKRVDNEHTGTVRLELVEEIVDGNAHSEADQTAPDAGGVPPQ